MIGKCITCDELIEKKFRKRFCDTCMQERRKIQSRVENQKRDGRKKIQYSCIICKIVFFSTGKRKHKICNKNKCQNYLKNLSKKIERLNVRIEQTDERKNLLMNKLVATEIQYQTFLNGTVAI
jgi:hypothetical protein